MSRRILTAGVSLAIALLFASIPLLTLAHAASVPQPGSRPPHTTPEAAADDKTIQGHAQTDDDPPQPVEGARIVVRASLGEDVVAQALTDADGAYELTFSSSGTCFRVSAQATDATRPASALPPAGWWPVCFGLGDVETVDFTFQTAGAQIVGRLLLSDTLSPPGFPVTVTARSRWSLEHPDVINVSQQIDARGLFTLPVSPATYDVLATPGDPCYYNPTDLLLASGVEVEGVHDLGTHYLSSVGETATLAGHVRTPAGAGVGGVEVRAVKVDLAGFQDPGVLPWPAATTRSDGAFSFCLPSNLAEGTWWVGVALGSADDYVPEPLDWWTTVPLSATQAVTDVELLVTPASAVISGELIQEQSGEPADDACGVVAAFKKGEPTVYNARPFVDGAFHIPVISGTYRLAVLPDPGLPITPALYPPQCAESMGKYLVRTEPEVTATSAATVTVPITVRVADATIHGRLWDAGAGMTVTGVAGQVVGWSQGNWSAAPIEPGSGLGQLRASSGSDWLLAYHVEPDAPYQELPGVTLAHVPTDASEVTTNLPLWSGRASLTGTVLTPSGEPVDEPVAVAAVGLGPAPSFSAREGLGAEVKPGGDTMLTENGRFTLTLGYGAYAVSVLGPVELLSDNAWISPEPQIVLLTPQNPSQEQDLQFREGDAVVHGRVRLPATARTAERKAPGEPTEPAADSVAASGADSALVWAATAGGRTKTWADVGAGGAYTLPLLAGQPWSIGAAYELDRQLWLTGTVITAPEGTTSIPLDLELTRAYSLAAGLARSIDAHLPSYGELEDGTSVHVPAGALAEGRATLQLQPSLLTALARLDVPQLAAGLGGDAPLADLLAAPPGLAAGEAVLLSPAYDLSVIDRMGRLPSGDDVRAPMALTIPYDEESLASYGLAESDVQAIRLEQHGIGWEMVESFLVDEEADAVAIFADQPGSYALVGINPRYQRLFLPLVLRGPATP